MKFKAFNYPINLENVHLIINSWHGPRSSPPNLDQWENVAYGWQLGQVLQKFVTVMIIPISLSTYSKSNHAK